MHLFGGGAGGVGGMGGANDGQFGDYAVTQEGALLFCCFYFDASQLTRIRTEQRWIGSSLDLWSSRMGTNLSRHPTT